MSIEHRMDIIEKEIKHINKVAIEASVVYPRMESAIAKIIDTLEDLSALQKDVAFLKNARETTSENMNKYIDDRISIKTSSTSFDDKIDNRIEKQVEIILNKKESRDDLATAIQDKLDDKFEGLQLSLFWKVTAFVGALLGIVLGTAVTVLTKTAVQG